MVTKKTDVSINGERETLVFGTRYRVRYGKESTIVDGILDSRAANGDLVFLVEPTEIDGIPVTKRRVRPSTIDAIVVGIAKLELDEAGEIRTEPAPDGHVRDELIAEHAAKKAKKADRETLDDRLAREVDAALDPALPAAILAGAIRTGKAYADRNQVWKCGTCKSRTRRPVCTGRPEGSHEPVSAPAGKRLVDRLGDQ